MAKIIFEEKNEEFEVEDGSELQPVCEDAGVPFACTEGVCGTCIIGVSSGNENLSEFTEAEEDFLGESDCGERLACQCRILNGEVKITY